MRPLVTVVIPTYNRGELLPQAIESVLAQTHGNVEVIVVDDGSTDATRLAVARFGDQIRYVYQAHQERAKARNFGLQLAKGEFIAFLDSDDAWYPHKLEAELAVLLRAPSVGFVHSDFEIWEGERKVWTGRGYRLREHRPVLDLIGANPIVCSGNLMRTEVIRSIGGFNEDPELSGSEDWDSWVRMSLVTRFAYLPLITAKLKRRTEITTAYTETMERSLARSCEIVETSGYLPAYTRAYLHRQRGRVALINAINYRCCGQRRNSLAWLLRSMRCSGHVLLDLRWYYTLLLDLIPHALARPLIRLRRSLDIVADSGATVKAESRVAESGFLPLRERG